MLTRSYKVQAVLERSNPALQADDRLGRFAPSPVRR